MKEKIEKLRNEGKSYKDICKILGIVRSTVSYHIGNRTGIKKKIYPKKNCRNCSKEIVAEKSYCDSKCDFEHKQKVRIENLEKGVLMTNYTIRKAIIAKKGNKCNLCNITSNWNGKDLTLHVDHVDGDSDNNTESNLRLLCPNCHSQLDTSKSKTKKVTKRNVYLRKYKGYKED